MKLIKALGSVSEISHGRVERKAGTSLLSMAVPACGEAVLHVCVCVCVCVSVRACARLCVCVLNPHLIVNYFLRLRLSSRHRSSASLLTIHSRLSWHHLIIISLISSIP